MKLEGVAISFPDWSSTSYTSPLWAILFCWSLRSRAVEPVPFCMLFGQPKQTNHKTCLCPSPIWLSEYIKCFSMNFVSMMMRSFGWEDLYNDWQVAEFNNSLVLTSENLTHTHTHDLSHVDMTWWRWQWPLWGSMSHLLLHLGHLQITCQEIAIQKSFMLNALALGLVWSRFSEVWRGWSINGGSMRKSKQGYVAACFCHVGLPPTSKLVEALYCFFHFSTMQVQRVTSVTSDSDSIFNGKVWLGFVVWYFHSDPGITAVVKRNPSNFERQKQNSNEKQNAKSAD